MISKFSTSFLIASVALAYSICAGAGEEVRKVMIQARLLDGFDGKVLGSGKIELDRETLDQGREYAVEYRIAAPSGYVAFPAEGQVTGRLGDDASGALLELPVWREQAVTGTLCSEPGVGVGGAIVRRVLMGDRVVWSEGDVKTDSEGTVEIRGLPAIPGELVHVEFETSDRIVKTGRSLVDGSGETVRLLGFLSQETMVGGGRKAIEAEEHGTVCASVEGTSEGEVVLVASRYLVKPIGSDGQVKFDDVPCGPGLIYVRDSLGSVYPPQFLVIERDRSHGVRLVKGNENELHLIVLRRTKTGPISCAQVRAWDRNGKAIRVWHGSAQVLMPLTGAFGHLVLQLGPDGIGRIEVEQGSRKISLNPCEIGVVESVL
jgi:hypothetical protein